MHVALDDFGTGYSNLGHLHKLAFDTIKLDQGFVRQLDDPRCLAIVRASSAWRARSAATSSPKAWKRQRS